MTKYSKASLVVICPSDTPLWAEKILTYLSEKGFHLTRAKPNTRKLLHLNGTRPDAVLFFRLEDGIRLSRQLNAPSIDGPKPLMVFVTDNPTEDTSTANADLVCPHIESFVEYQLNSSLQLHYEKDARLKEIAQLKIQLSEVKEYLLRQERTTREIEILKNAIVRNVSHELKTPLLQVKSAVALLAEDVKDDKLITYAKGATARLEALVKNITMLGSSLDQNPSPVIIRDTIEYARRNLGRVWEHQDSNERVILEIQENLPPVLADKQGLSTVLQLLMDNALKFSKSPKDSIFVSVQRVNDHVRILIKDEGIGIAREQLTSIFDSFYQIDSSSTRRYGGMGVGLAIVKLILDNHQAQINVDSQVDKGTTFWFDLPIIQL